MKYGKRLKINIVAFLMLFSSATIVFSDPPLRIISLAPSFTEQLYLLGTYKNIVANTTYCKIPAGESGKKKIGTIRDINIEEIVRLKPDLVLTTKLTNIRSVRKLEGLGIAVKVFPQPKGFEEVCQQFIELGSIVGKRSEAEAIVAVARKQVAIIKGRVSDFDRPKVFVQLGARPLFAATGDSFVDDFVDFAGGINITRGLSSGLYSREAVVRHNPDIILIVTMGLATKEKEVWGRFSAIKAVQTGRVYIMDAYRLCSPSPANFPEILSEIVNIFHPEAGE